MKKISSIPTKTMTAEYENKTNGMYRKIAENKETMGQGKGKFTFYLYCADRHLDHTILTALQVSEGNY